MQGQNRVKDNIPRAIKKVRPRIRASGKSVGKKPVHQLADQRNSVGPQPFTLASAVVLSLLYISVQAPRATY